MRITQFWTVIALLLSFGCAAQNGPGERPTTPPPFHTGNAEVDRALAQEVPLGRDRRLATDSGFRAIVPFEFEHSIEDGFDRLDVSLVGAESIARCYIFPDRLGLGTSLLRVGLFGVDSFTEPLKDELRYNEVIRVHGGHIGGTPYQGAEWLTLSTKSSAHSKVLVASRADAS